MYLNLSKTIAFRGNCIGYQHFTFPGGEEHIKLGNHPAYSPRVKIISSLKSSSDAMALLMATDALKRKYGPRVPLELFAPYFPYARQDRQMVPGEPLSVKVMADLINSQGYEKVQVFDPHSDVCPALIDRVEVIPNHAFAYAAISQIMEFHRLPVFPCPGKHQGEANLGGATASSQMSKRSERSEIKSTSIPDEFRLISPDAGAEKKIYKLGQYLGLSNDHILCAYKRRDVASGQIVETKFEGDIKDKIAIIVDDIIDGGRTFTELAAILKARGAKYVYLIASHGILSKGIEPLRETLDGVFITDSFNRVNNYFVSTVDLERIMDI